VKPCRGVIGRGMMKPCRGRVAVAMRRGALGRLYALRGVDPRARGDKTLDDGLGGDVGEGVDPRARGDKTSTPSRYRRK
jgi:hypothetical protein